MQYLQIIGGDVLHIYHGHAVNRFKLHGTIAGHFYSRVQTRFAIASWTPCRIKNSIYHAHEVYKTIKKHGHDIYAARPRQLFEDTALFKYDVCIFNLYFQLFSYLFNSAIKIITIIYNKITVLPEHFFRKLRF